MKCLINGEIVNAKTVEMLGFQGGYIAREVEYKGGLYIVVKDGGVWRQRTPQERL